MNVSQESQGLNVAARGKPQMLEEKSWHGAPTLPVAGEKKRKKRKKGKKPALDLLFGFEKTEQNHSESTSKRSEWRWNMSI